LNNIGRHSGAGSVDISLTSEHGGLRLEIADNGKGFDPKAAPGSKTGGGFGLAGMRERAELSGGQFHIRTRRGAGTSIVVIWPEDKTGSLFVSAG
ncbi:MAG: sensor histidine kinase, partial [Desulfobacterales bacterium]